MDELFKLISVEHIPKSLNNDACIIAKIQFYDGYIATVNASFINGKWEYAVEPNDSYWGPIFAFRELVLKDLI